MDTKELRLKAAIAAINRTAIVLRKDHWKHEVYYRYKKLIERMPNNDVPNGTQFVHDDEEIQLLRNIIRNF